LTVQVGQLGTLRKLASGGQGQIYEVEDARATALGLRPPVIFKEYLVAPPVGAESELRRRVDWLVQLDRDDREALLEVAAWPLAVVEGPSRPLQGILMRNLAPAFARTMSLPSGGSRPMLVSLEHALQDDGRLDKRFGAAVDTRARALIAASIATSLQILHRDAIVASDISQKNLLVQIEPPYRAAFIDCDSMVFQGRLALPVVETPGWDIEGRWGEQPTTKEADNLKLALAILRLFTRQQSTMDASAGAGHVPDELMPLLESALTASPRPTAGEWQRTLNALPFGELNRRYPGPAPRHATATHGTVPPSPAPAWMPPTTHTPAPAAATPPVTPPPAGPPRPPARRGSWGPVPVGPIGVVVAVALVVVAVVLNSNSAGGSSGGSTVTTQPVTSPPDGPSGGSTTRTRDPRPRQAAASSALARHYHDLNIGRYEDAFALMTPAYQRDNQRWIALRRKANPTIRVMSLHQRSRAGARARVTLRFYAQDTVPVQGSDTKCRQFRGDAQMVQIDGRWLYKPHSEGFHVKVVDSALCH
jgi:hypothetical protein